jgi:hypothetical protein
MTCWRIKAGTGSVDEVAREPRGVRDVFEAGDDQEELLYAAVALAPQFIDAAGELPMRFIGGAGSPDLELVDRITGRATLVECKKTTARVQDLVQLMSYAYLRASSGRPVEGELLATGAMPREVYGALLARATGDADTRKAAHRFLAVDKGSSMETRIADVDEALGGKQRAARMGDSVGERLWGSDWTKMKDGSATLGAIAPWSGDCRRPLPGSPQRLVLLAPNFDEKCRHVAKLLVHRGVWVDLVAVSVQRADGGGDLFVRANAESTSRCVAYQHLWGCMRSILGNDWFAAHCASRGLSLYSEDKERRYPAWSFYSQSLPKIDMELSARWEGDATIFVRLQHGVLDGQKQERATAQRALREKLQLVKGCKDATGGDWYWKFSLPGQRERCAETFVQIARAMDAISSTPEMGLMKMSR